MRTVRLFSILDQLRGRRRPISAEALADVLNVSVRTIYRDISTLQSMGAPIRGEGGVGYQIEAGFFLPPLHFDPDELDALILGIRMVSVRGDENLARAAGRVLGKIETVLSGDDKSVDQPLLAVGTGKSDKKAFGLSGLKQSIRNRKKILLKYQDDQGQRSTRTVRPLGLTAFESVWVLTAWCQQREDFRNFRLDRMISANETDETFKRERGKEFSDYLASL
ncbi:MAG: YafY family protein [Roseibium sp.]